MVLTDNMKLKKREYFNPGFSVVLLAVQEVNPCDILPEKGLGNDLDTLTLSHVPCQLYTSAE